MEPARELAPARAAKAVAATVAPPSASSAEAGAAPTATVTAESVAALAARDPSGRVSAPPAVYGKKLIQTGCGSPWKGLCEVSDDGYDPTHGTEAAGSNPDTPTTPLVR